MRNIFLSVLALTPYLVSYNPEDSSFTDIEFGGGTGQYRYEDCHGSGPQKFGDVGFKYTHKTAGPFRYGLLVGIPFYNSNERHSYLFPLPYPDVAFDSRYVSLGTTGLRVGDLNQFYLSVGLANKVPLYTGRGFLNAGAGIHPGSLVSDIWMGVNAGPYQSLSFAMNPEFQISEDRFLFFSARYGESRGVSEYGLSIGMRIRTW